MEFGIQLYSLRDEAARDFEAAVAAVAALGYKYIEFAGFFGRSAAGVRALLDRCNVGVSGTHTGWRELADDFAGTVAYHRAIGNRNIIIPGADLTTPKKLDDFIDFLNEVQPRLAAEGIALGYHNHSREFIVNDWGVRTHDELAARTAVEFEIDTYWAYAAGEDPVALLRRFAGRERVLHLKDGTPDGHGLALGEGSAPLAQIIAAASQLGLLPVVESETQKPDGPAEVTRCMNWLRANAGA